MTVLDHTTMSQLEDALAARERDLCALLRAREAQIAPGEDRDEVSDFKDLASEEAQSVVDENQAEHAALELEQVLAARRRLKDGTYGTCQACGEPIDVRRLLAMPHTTYCIACQRSHEQVRTYPIRH